MIETILSYVQSGIALIFIFAVLVMFHELGHYLAARACGIRVEEFAFGFGPKLITLFKRGDTEYTVHPFPLGGFVKLAGMDPGQEDVADGFQAQSVGRRAFVIFSGPFASLLLGVVVFLILGLVWGYPGPELTNRVAMVSPQTEAHRIDLRAGDRITEINGVLIDDGAQMLTLINSNPGRRIGLVHERRGQEFKKEATPMWEITYLGAQWRFAKPNVGVVEGVSETGPAGKAGVHKGDVIKAINGTPIRTAEDIERVIGENGLEKVSLTLQRGDESINVEATPIVEWVRVGGARWRFPGAYVDSATSSTPVRLDDVLVSVDGEEVKNAQQFMDAIRRGTRPDARFVVMREGKEQVFGLRILPEDREELQHGAYIARGILGFMPDSKLVKTSAGESIMIGLRTPLVFAQRLMKIDVKQDVGGPIMIAKMTHTTSALGPYYLLSLMGGLSMSLAFINLLPIPVVDGGHLMILGIEKVRRKRLTPEQMGVFTLVGMAIIMALIVVVMSSDILKLINNLTPQ